MKSFTEFYERHYSLLLAVAQQRLAGLSSAEDVVAETFTIAWSHHQQGNALTLPWLYQVLRNLIANEYRRNARSSDLIERAGSVLGSNSSELTTDDLIGIRRLVRQLPDGERDLIYMAYWEDLSRADIASILDCSTTAVRLRLMRARRHLKALEAGSTPAIVRKEQANG